MHARNALAIAALLAVAVPGPARADHYYGHHGSIYGPRNGTGSNFYDRQPNSGSDPWHQPRRPTIQNQWDQPRGTNPREQPRKPDLYPWGKPKY
ncbi:MAG TPA: hypothetical protein VIF14_10195 [Alphaproteobacteria bacterium]|jgi:hypothetical protein